MARYGASATKSSSAAAGWVFQLRQPSTARPLRLLELGLFTTTAVAGTYGLVRASSVGATFTSVSGTPDDLLVSGGTGVLDTAATTAPTPASTTNFPRTVAFPATAGSGIVWTFPQGLGVAAAGGLVIYQTSAAAVGLAVYAAWDE